MPILNFPLTPTGPILDILIGVSEPKRQALLNAGQPVPQPIQIRALVDTGASITSIVSSAIQPLGLSPTGTVGMTTPSTGSTPVICDQYDVSLLILHPFLSRAFPVVPIVECAPLHPAFQALLGRDLLGHCMFIYNGPFQLFSLAF